MQWALVVLLLVLASCAAQGPRGATIRLVNERGEQLPSFNIMGRQVFWVGGEGELR